MFLFSPLFILFFFFLLSHLISSSSFFESESYVRKLISQTQLTFVYLNILSHTCYHEKMYSKCTYFAEVYMSVLFLSPTVYNGKCSLFQYMSMYVYHVNNGDGNLNCIICA
jgi:hypothetical protein